VIQEALTVTLLSQVHHLPVLSTLSCKFGKTLLKVLPENLLLFIAPGCPLLSYEDLNATCFQSMASTNAQSFISLFSKAFEEIEIAMRNIQIWLLG